MAEDKNFVVELNEAARACSNVDYRNEVKLAATRLHNALEELRKLPIRGNIQDVNAAWTRAYILLDGMPPEAEPDPPLSGSTTATKIAVNA